MERVEKPVISVIVPVYNVEPYLHKCLDSVVNQTYENLEILIVDDGSTDESGRICDEYTKDVRVKVFHTENRGLSAARNLGLDNANGDWIGFVDSDDWIEPDMYEVLLKSAMETGADVVECGIFIKYPDRTERHKRYNRVLTGSEAIRALLEEELSENAWNKLWKKSCFKSIRFPEGRIFEDIATTYKIYKGINRLSSIKAEKYHYEQREGSLSRKKTMKNLSDFWLSHYERFMELYDEVDDEEIRRLQLYCGSAAARTWAYYYDCKKEEREAYNDKIRKMADFTKEHIPFFGYKGWGWKLRIGVLFPHYCNRLSFRSSWIMKDLANAVCSRNV